MMRPVPTAFLSFMYTTAQAQAASAIALGQGVMADQPGFFVKPIRSSTSAGNPLDALKYDTTTAEVYHEIFSGTITANTIAPTTGTDVTISGNLVVTGTSTHTGLETFNAGIATNTIARRRAPT